MNKKVFFLGGIFIFIVMLYASNDPIFIDSGQRLGVDHSYGVSLGDLDGDGDLDAFVTSVNMSGEDDSGCKVWLNNGNGIFADSGQHLRPDLKFYLVALGDIDSDGDIDAIATSRGHDAILWLNNGTGIFTESSQALENTDGNGIAVNDFNHDGRLDIFIASDGCSVFINNGDGSFSKSEQYLWPGATQGVACGDLNGDTYPDIYLAAYGADMVFLNDGTGQFVSSEPWIGDSASEDVALGDLDGDGDLDAFVVNELGQPNEVWQNDGFASFARIWTSPENLNSRAVKLKDIDGDGDLDAFVANFNQYDKVWLNNGDGTFVDSGQEFNRAESQGVDLGDLDGDGDIDAYLSKAGPDEVWLNQTGDYLNVSIDIKPGTEPNSINLGSNGNIPVVIFSTAEFDATTIDPLSVKLAGANVRLKGKATPMVTWEDVNKDGLIDLIVHVDTSALQLTYGDTEAVLEGQTYSGLKFKGTDTVRIIR